jgi:hypothetical protein
VKLDLSQHSAQPLSQNEKLSAQTFPLTDLDRVSYVVEHLEHSVANENWSEVLACMRSLDMLLLNSELPDAWNYLREYEGDLSNVICQSLQQNWLDALHNTNAHKQGAPCPTEQLDREKPTILKVIMALPADVRNELLIAPLVEASAKQSVSTLTDTATELLGQLKSEISPIEYQQVKKAVLCSSELRKRCLDLALTSLETGEVAPFLEYRASIWFAGHAIIPSVLSRACWHGIENKLDQFSVCEFNDELEECLKDIAGLAALGSLDKLAVWSMVVNDSSLLESITDHQIRLVSALFFPLCENEYSPEEYVEKLLLTMEETSRIFHSAIAGLLYMAAQSSDFPLSSGDIQWICPAPPHVPAEFVDQEVCWTRAEHYFDEVALPVCVFEDRTELVPSLATPLGRKAYKAYSELLGVTTTVQQSMNAGNEALSGEYSELTGDVRSIDLAPEVWSCPWASNPLIDIVFDHEFGHAELQLQSMNLSNEKVDGYCSVVLHDGHRLGFTVDELYQHALSIEQARAFRDRNPLSEKLSTCWLEQARDTNWMLIYHQALVSLISTIEYSNPGTMDLSYLDKLPTQTFQAKDPLGQRIVLNAVVPELLVLDGSVDCEAIVQLSNNWFKKTKILLGETHAFLIESSGELALYFGQSVASIVSAKGLDPNQRNKAIENLLVDFGFLHDVGILAVANAIKDSPASNNFAVSDTLGGLIDEADANGSPSELFYLNLWRELFGYGYVKGQKSSQYID